MRPPAFAPMRTSLLILAALLVLPAATAHVTLPERWRAEALASWGEPTPLSPGHGGSVAPACEGTLELRALGPMHDGRWRLEMRARSATEGCTFERAGSMDVAPTENGARDLRCRGCGTLDVVLNATGNRLLFYQEPGLWLDCDIRRETSGAIVAAPEA